MAQYTFDNIVECNIAIANLPSGYTKLNYIENTGNSYILLNYKANNNTIVEATLSYNSTSGDQAPYGCDHWGQYRNSGFLVFLSPSLSVDFGNQRVGLSQGVNIGSWYTFKQSQEGFFLNGNKLTSFNSQTFTCTNNFAIFTFGASVSGNSFLNGKMKAISVKDLTENFELIACQNSNNEIGMYDVVNNVFYGNNGTGTFTSGGTAPTYNFQNGDEIIISSTKTHYQYQDGDLVFYYQEIPPLVFRGITFEQTDYWQKPEFVFRGFSFEITDKVGGASMFHGMV